MRIEQDESHPDGGFVRMVFAGRGSAAEGGLRVQITRFSQTQSSLGPHGWQPAEHAFKPRKIRVEGADLVLILGPEVTDNIEDYTSICVTVPKLGVEESLRWPSLQPSMGFEPGGPEVVDTDDGADVPIEYAAGPSQAPQRAHDPSPGSPAEDSGPPAADQRSDAHSEDPPAARGGERPGSDAASATRSPGSTGSTEHDASGDTHGHRDPGKGVPDDGRALRVARTDQEADRTPAERRRRRREALAAQSVPGSQQTRVGAAEAGQDGDAEQSGQPHTQEGGPQRSHAPEKDGGVQRTRKLPWLAVGLGALFLAAAVTAALLLFPDTEPAPVTEETGPTSPSDPEDAPGSDDSPVPEEGGTTEREAEAEPTLSEVERRHAEAMDALESGNADTAVPLLHRNAAADHAPSAMALAEYYATREPGEALRRAADACRMGVSEGASRFADIRTQIEDSAAAGNSMAQFALDVELDAARRACGR